MLVGLVYMKLMYVVYLDFFNVLYVIQKIEYDINLLINIFKFYLCWYQLLKFMIEKFLFGLFFFYNRLGCFVV